jgi:dolichol-phosphate mannosyltransferase
MPSSPEITVVGPAYGEEARIGAVVRAMPACVRRVFVVDDASRDRTAEVARAASDGRVTVVRHRENRGVGAAIVTGYEAALATAGDANDAFVVMAGDAQMDPADLPRVAAPVLAGLAGYVKGNRFGAADVLRVMPTARWVGGHVLSWMTSRAIGVPIRDSQCGYTALARWACASLDLGALWPRYGYPNDLLSQLALRGVPIREVPVRPVYAGEKSGLRAAHVPGIARLVARAYVRRLTSPAPAPGSAERARGRDPDRTAP